MTGLMPGAGEVIAHPSPNFGPRRDGLVPHLVVIHFTAMPSLEAALERLTSPEHQVSAHYLIGRDGRLYGLVDEVQRAWHAGHGIWGGLGDVNSRSIGVELDNTGSHPFAAAQIDRLEALLADLMARWQIPPEGIIAHSDFAPTRKADPGARFDWRRLARRGLSVWPDCVPVPVDEAGFLAAAARFGYPVEDGLAAVLGAVRLRFRPWASGELAPEDMGAILDLAARFAVDRSGADT